MVASEAVPFAKTGGLADVTTALSRALGRRGHQVTLVLPRYGAAGDSGAPAGSSDLRLGARVFRVAYRAAALGGAARAVLVDCPELFDREGLYRPPNGSDYEDNPLRFAVLARAALDVAGRDDAPPDIVHTHDWQGGLTAVYLRHDGDAAPRECPATVQTIHNLAYQGLCERRWLSALDLPDTLFTPAALEFHGQVSLLKGGIVFSDRVTTVSPAHAREVTTPEHGCGLDGLLRACGPRFSGVLNGIDTEEWDPGRDRYLPATYGAEDLAGKAACKKALLARFGLPTDRVTLDRPLVGMISRLVEQKGHGLIAPVADALVALGVTFVVMGEGEARFQRMWRELAGRWPGRVALHVGYDEPRAHLIQGGADLFLLPSLFEPCGLSQMYAQRYGTLPVVRATGGLADTVEPHDPRTGLGTGFVFRDATPHALLETMRYAVEMGADRRAWEGMQRRAMARDFSWDRSAGEYERVYEQALGG